GGLTETRQVHRFPDGLGAACGFCRLDRVLIGALGNPEHDRWPLAGRPGTRHRLAVLEQAEPVAVAQVEEAAVEVMPVPGPDEIVVELGAEHALVERAGPS